MAKYIVEIADEITKDSQLVPFEMCRPSWWEEAYNKGKADAEAMVIHCKDCRWWNRESEDSPMGYCHACKHSHYSGHWEIVIIRTYKENFFCADAEPKEEGEEDD